MKQSNRQMTQLEPAVGDKFPSHTRNRSIDVTRERERNLHKICIKVMLPNRLNSDLKKATANWNSVTS